MFRATVFPLFAIFAASVVGCGGESGPPKFIIKGRITLRGEPITVTPIVGKLRVWLMLQDVPPPVDPKYASIKPDGNFEIHGNEDKGIGAGKYKVCVMWQDDYPLGPDRLNNQFDPENSPIYHRVPEDGDLVIDVSRPKG